MSTALSVKRRKIEQSQSALSKPFVSPLRRVKADRKPLHEDCNSGNELPYLPSTLAHTVKAADYASSDPTTSTTRPFATPKPPISRPSSCGTYRPADPAEVAARRAVKALEIQIKTLRNEIDIINQARRIETSSTNRELVNLTEKWRTASQQVADELFESVKERVSQMGGVAAWREAEKRKTEAANVFWDFAQRSESRGDEDADCESDGQREHLTEGAGEHRERKRRWMTEEAPDPPGKEVDESDSGTKRSHIEREPNEDGNTFTMEMMLRSLRVDPDLIGFDRENQTWK